MSNKELYCIYDLGQQHTLSVKWQTVNILDFGVTWSMSTPQLCSGCPKAALGNMQINGRACILLKCQLFILKFEFHIVFMCHERIFFWFSPTFKSVKTILYKTGLVWNLGQGLQLANTWSRLTLPLKSSSGEILLDWGELELPRSGGRVCFPYWGQILSSILWPPPVSPIRF